MSDYRFTTQILYDPPEMSAEMMKTAEEAYATLGRIVDEQIRLAIIGDGSPMPGDILPPQPCGCGPVLHRVDCPAGFYCS